MKIEIQPGAIKLLSDIDSKTIIVIWKEEFDEIIEAIDKSRKYQEELTKLLNKYQGYQKK